MQFKIIGNLSEIWDQYQGYILDLWGVVHDGHDPYGGVVECLRQLQDLKKQVVFLSNAPRRSWVVKDLLLKMGIDSSLYQHLITSGDDAYESLKTRTFHPYKNLGKRCFYFGLPKDHHMLEGNGLEEVSDIKNADFILAIHTFVMGEGLKRYESLLRQGVQKNIPLICVNPDLVVHIKGEEHICAGTLAEWYKKEGGIVYYHGKPHPDIYERALGLFSGLKNSQILCIGDSLKTDVKGALEMGLDVAFVPGGIHKADLSWEMGNLPSKTSLEHLFEREKLCPTYVIPGLICS